MATSLDKPSQYPETSLNYPVEFLVHAVVLVQGMDDAEVGLYELVRDALSDFHCKRVLGLV